MNEILTAPENILVESKQGSATLVLISSLLEALHEHDIIYCHWKSNEHLAASMTGDTDLDILFLESEKERLEPVLAALGFKQFQPIAQKQYKDIEDFIGMDAGAGKLVHLHAHFRLTLGEAYLKSYQLPFERSVLETRFFDPAFGIYCIQPAWEYVLLYFREALKLRNRNLISYYIRNETKLSQNTIREYAWLRERCTDAAIKRILEQIFTNYRPAYRLLTRSLDRGHLVLLSALLRTEFRKYRMFSPLHALMLRWYREVSIKAYRKSKILLDHPVLTRRTNPRGGLVVAVVGADGSGKSTVIKNLQETFSGKLDVFKVYLGRGDGRISVPRKLLIGLKNRIFPHKGKKNESKKGNGTDAKKGWIADTYKCVEAVMVAREKYNNLKRVQAAQKKGMLVICDRFPQNQVMGYNDGPLLHHLIQSGNPFFKAIAQWERKQYDFAAAHPPHLLLKLVADAAVVAARKPNETSLKMLQAKIAGIRAMQQPGSRVVVIDAAQPLEQVLATVKKELWASLK